MSWSLRQCLIFSPPSAMHGILFMTSEFGTHLHASTSSRCSSFHELGLAAPCIQPASSQYFVSSLDEHAGRSTEISVLVTCTDVPHADTDCRYLSSGWRYHTCQYSMQFGLS